MKLKIYGIGISLVKKELQRQLKITLYMTNK